MGTEDTSATFDDWHPEGGSPGATIRGPDVQLSVAPARLPHVSLQEGESPLAEAAPELRVGELLGAGGMGRVHRAHQPLLDRDVAIKRLHPGAAPSARSALLREARYMGSLEHPGIVPVHALGADADGAPVLVMKRIEGFEFRELLHDAEHPAWSRHAGVETDRLGRCVEVLIEVCRAVDFAHSRGVVHLDLKPENVVVGGYGDVYVLDWGIARRLDGGAPRGLAGTPAYLPPEMAQPGAPPAVTMDVYLLGACLFEVLSGAPPHPGERVEDVLEAAREGALRPLPAGLPPGLVSLCRQALATAPEDRPPTALALSRALTRWLRRRDIERTLGRCEALTAEVEEALGSEVSYRSLADAFAAARFGYQQVLEQLPDERSAVDGLARGLAAMVRLEVQQQSPSQARRWLDELEGLRRADPELVREVDELEATVARHRALAEDMDLDAGSSSHFVALMGLAMVSFLLLVIAVLASRGEAPGFTHAHTVRAAAVILAVVAGLFVFKRDVITSNTANRGLYASVVLVMAGLLAHRLIAWHLDWPMREVFLVDLLLLGVAMTVLGWLTRRWIGVFGWVCLAMVPVSVAWTGAPETLFGLSTLLGLGLSLLVRRYDGSAAGP